MGRGSIADQQDQTRSNGELVERTQRNKYSLSVRLRQTLWYVPTTQSLIWFCTLRATTGSKRIKVGSHGAMFGQMGHSGDI